MLEAETCAAFSYSPLAAGHIRLLSPNGVGSVLTCTLSDRLLEQTLEFNALSYVWGKQKATKSVICNGSIFLVTPHLYDALYQISSSAKPRHVWIDAICINQQDNDEREAQVAMMDKVYTYARAVLVWLGPNEDDSDHAMDSMPQLHQLLSAVRNEIANDDNLPDGCPRLEDGIWRAIGLLYSRPWFNRLWVFQEAVLATEIVVLCGSKQVLWDDFCGLASELVRLGLQSRARGREVVDVTRGDGFAAMAHFNLVRAARLKGNPYSLTTLLLLLRLKDVTDPVDRINGVLGLITNELKKQFFIKYGEFRAEEVWKGYLRVGKVLVQQEPIGFLSMASSIHRPKGLPSWCANFNSPAKFTSLVSHEYQAGYSKDQDYRREISLMPNSDCLRVKGLQVDEVAAIVDLSFQWPDIEPKASRIEAAKKAILWEEACSSISKRLFGPTDGIPEEHWRTMIANHIGTGAAGPTSQSEDYANMKACFHIFARPESISLRGYDTPQTRSMMEYVKRLEACSLGRNFFSTKAGRIGLGPSGIARGDTVCIPYGSPTPLILRPGGAAVPDAPSWELIGDAYVHGLMNGEALTAPLGREHGIYKAVFIIA